MEGYSRLQFPQRRGAGFNSLRSGIASSFSAGKVGPGWSASRHDQVHRHVERLEREYVDHLVALDPQVLQEAITPARRQGITVDTLVHLAVKDALGRSPPTGSRARLSNRHREAGRVGGGKVLINTVIS